MQGSWVLAAGCLIAGVVGLWLGDAGGVGAGMRLLSYHAPLALGSLALAGKLGGRWGAGRFCVLTWVRAGQIYLATLIGIGLVLGLVGQWTRVAAFLAASASGWILLWHGREALRAVPVASARSGDRTSAWLSFALSIVLSWGVARAVFSPRYEYDTLTYHLTFPALWCQRQAITLIPTWFGDPSPGYAPLGCEVYYAWLMLVTGDDLLARCGQVPFWLLLIGCVALLTRELRMSPRTRRATCLAVAMTPTLTLQAGTAMVDVAVAAHVAGVVLFALRLARRKRPEELVGLILSAGLLLSTKYLALACAAATVPVVAYGIARAGRMSWKRGGVGVAAALALSVGIGTLWYGRNAVLTGNPVYPMEVKLGPVKVADGAYGRAQMESSPFNIRRREGMAGLPPLAGRAMFDRNPEGAIRDARLRTAWRRVVLAMPVIVSALFVVAVVQAARARGGKTLLVAAAAVLAFAVFWWGSPFQQPRFAWPALVLMMVVIAGGSARPRLARTATVLAGCLWACVCLAAFWLQGAGGALVVAATLVLALGAGFAHRIPRRPMWAAGAVVLAPLILWAGARVSPDPRTAAFAAWPLLGEAWAFVDEHVHGKTIAYTGNNVPYFLFGRRFENRVVHVPACSPGDGLFHEHARAPIARSLGPPNTSEPTPHRYDMRFDAWLENLRAARVDYVLVNSMNLFPNLLLNVQHDQAGFPIERLWLDAMSRAAPGREPSAVPLAFGRGGVLLYALNWGEAPPIDVPGARSRSEAVDAIGQLALDRTPEGQPIPNYPRARAVLERMGWRDLSR